VSEEPDSSHVLKFTGVDGGGSVGFVACISGSELPENYSTPNINYSIDEGITWQSYTVNLTCNIEEAELISVLEGGTVYFRGVNETLSYDSEEEDNVTFRCYITGTLVADNDITSLLNNIGGDIPIPDYCFFEMFRECDGLKQPPKLPSTTLGTGCYNHMFYGCYGLTQAPVLPAVVLTENCYYSMFVGCLGLTQAPVLPATILETECYHTMFFGCANIVSYDIATLNNSQNIFTGNTSCTELTIHAETPPDIGSTTITGLKSDCIIYVPEGSVEAYKTAPYWSARANYIQPIP
jgi:hypothetical protein